MDHNKLLDGLTTDLSAKLINSLDMAVKCCKMMLENGISPLPEHRVVAVLWAKGHLSDEEFIRLAGAVSEMFDNGR